MQTMFKYIKCRGINLYLSNKLFITHSDQRGYTLAEVLIALFIFVIIISTIGYSLIHIAQSVKSLKVTEQRLTEIQLMLTLVNFDLNQVINKERPDQGSFYTRANKLHFIKTGNINPHYQFNRSCLEEVVYHFENSNLVR